MRGCVLAATLLFWPRISTDASQIIVATGPSDGTYRLVAAAIKQAVEAECPDLRVILQTTQGSPENADLLREGKVDLALVQSDVVGREVQVRYGGRAEESCWRTVLALFQEPVQVVADRAVTGDSLSALSGRSVALGHRGGGTHFAAVSILEALGVEYDEVPVDSATGVSQKLSGHKAQAGFFVSNTPTPQVSFLLSHPSFRLLSLVTPEMSRIQAASAYYVPFEIHPRTYPNQPRLVHTIAILNLLVCRSDVRAEVSRQVATAIMRDVESPTSSVRRARSGIDLASVLALTEKSALPVHDGAQSAIDTVPVAARVANYVQWIVWALAIALVVGAMGVSYNRQLRVRVMNSVGRRLPRSISRLLRPLFFNRLLWHVLRTGSVTLLLWLVGAAFMYTRENDVNVNFSDLKTSALSIIVYLFSGLEDRPPVTAAGWLGSVAMLVIGLFIAAYITGKFASEITLHASGVIQMTKNTARDCILIVGWSSRAERVVGELFGAWDENVDESSITVLSEEKVETSRYPELDSRGVTFITGNTCDKKVLERIGAARARCVLVLAEDQEADPDSKAAMVVLAIRNLTGGREQASGQGPRICVEVKNHRRMGLIYDAGADEVVCHEDFGLGVLTQSAFAPDIADVYQELLTYGGSESCEVYIPRSPRDGLPSDIPDEVWSGLFLGRSFAEASRVFLEAGDQSNPVILIGVRRGRRVHLNPRQLHLQEGDDLVVISYSRPRMDGLRSLLARNEG